MIRYRILLIVVAITAVVGSPTTAAQNGLEDAFAGAAPAFDQSTPKRTDYNVGDWGVAEQTGTVTYTYPIEVPPGRNGMQPELALRYSSRAPLRGSVAAGWRLNIPEIKLDRSRGEEPGGSYYRVSMGSVSGRLIEVPDAHPPFPGGRSTTYRAEFDGTFTRFIYRQRSQTRDWEWLVLTTDGVQYYFNDDKLPTTFKRTRWHVTRQVDPHGDEIRYFWEPVFEGGGDEGTLQDVSGDGVLDRLTAAQDGDACELHWNKTFFGGDEQVPRTTIPDASIPLFADLDGDGALDFHRCRYPSAPGVAMPTTKTAIPTAASWRNGRSTTKATAGSPTGVGRTPGPACPCSTMPPSPLS